MVWDKPGVSDAMIERDQFECEKDTRMSAASFGGGFTGQARAEQFFQRCMAARGYRRLQ
jgi:hypothetical protein